MAILIIQSCFGQLPKKKKLGVSPANFLDQPRGYRATPQGRRLSASDTAQGRIQTGDHPLASSASQPPHYDGPNDQFATNSVWGFPWVARTDI